VGLAKHVARHRIDAVAEKEGEGKYGLGERAVISMMYADS